MNSKETTEILESELNGYKDTQPKEGSTIGDPWSNNKVMS